MKGLFKKQIALLIALSMFAAIPGMAPLAFADPEGGGTGALYTTYAWETFETEITDALEIYQLPFNHVYHNGNGAWSYVDGKYGKGVKFFKVEEKQGETAYSQLDVELSTPITFAEAVENNLIVEIEFDYYGAELGTDDNYLWLTSARKSPVNSNVKIQFKANGQTKILNYGGAAGVDIKGGNIEEFASFHTFKLTIQADETAGGWVLRSFYYDGVDQQPNAKFETGQYMGTGDFTDLLFQIKTNANEGGEFGVDNVLVTAYPSPLDGVSPVPDRHTYMSKVLEYKETVDAYNAAGIINAYNAAMELFYDDYVLQEDFDSALQALDAVAADYKKLHDYEEKFSSLLDDADVSSALQAARDAVDSGDLTAIANAFQALDELEAKLPVVVTSYTFDDAAATRRTVANTNRYVFDGESFQDEYGYGGAFYWDFDYNDDYTDNGNGNVTDSQKGKSTTIVLRGADYSAKSIDLTSMPANSYIETAFDIKYNLNDQSVLILQMKGTSDFERFTIGSSAISARHEGHFSASSSENEMHRVKITMQVTDTAGEPVYKIVGLSVDGNEANTAYAHEVEKPANATSYTGIEVAVFTNGTYHAVPDDLVDFNKFWIDNFSVVTYVSASGDSLVGDKYALAQKIHSLSAIHKNEDVSEAVKTAIEAAVPDILEVFRDPAASKARIDDAGEVADDIITQVVKEEFENLVNTTFGFDAVTDDIEQMAEGFTSSITATKFDVAYTTSNAHVLTGTGSVTRPRMNENVVVNAIATSDTTGQSFSAQFNAKVMAQGAAASLPVTGSMLAYADVIGASGGTVHVTATGIDEVVNIDAGTNAVQLYADTKAGKYAVFVNGVKAAQDVFTADSIETVSIGGGAVSIIKPGDDSLIEISRIKFKIGDSDREYTKLLPGARVSSVEFMDRNVFGEAAYLVAASYSNNGKQLYSINMVALEDTSFDEYNTVNIEIPLPDDIADTSIRIYAFSSLGALVPVASAYTYEPDTTTAVGATIYIAGDSTAQSYYWAASDTSSYPQAGWGQMFSNYMLDVDGISIENCAMGGSSAKSYYNSADSKRSFTYIADHIVPGDYLLIQFGHNDMIRDTDSEEVLLNTRSTIEEYKEYMQKYVDMAKEAGATPIILTSIQRRGAVGTSSDPLEPYREAAREVAEANYIDCIDMGAITNDLLLDIGNGDYGKFLYLYIDADDVRYRDSAYFTKYSQGIEDGSHLNFYGADVFAMLIAREFAGLDSTQSVAAYVNTENILDDSSLRTKILADYASYISLKEEAAQSE